MMYGFNSAANALAQSTFSSVPFPRLALSLALFLISSHPTSHLLSHPLKPFKNPSTMHYYTTLQPFLSRFPPPCFQTINPFSLSTLRKKNSKEKNQNPKIDQKLTKPQKAEQFKNDPRNPNKNAQKPAGGGGGGGGH